MRCAESSRARYIGYRDRDWFVIHIQEASSIHAQYHNEITIIADMALFRDDGTGIVQDCNAR